MARAAVLAAAVTERGGGGGGGDARDGGGEGGRRRGWGAGKTVATGRRWLAKLRIPVAASSPLHRPLPMRDANPCTLHG